MSLNMAKEQAMESSALTQIQGFWSSIQRVHQKFLDDITPYSYGRWGFTLFITITYILRVLTIQGWYVVTYALGIYLLNLFLGFLTPKFDPAYDVMDSMEAPDDLGEGPSLPTSTEDEFKPFLRRLPEFKFWYLGTRAIFISFGCTFFEIFDIPVFWPILLFYFIFLFALTMRRQIQHMIRYKYIPFDLGKKNYSK